MRQNTYSPHHDTLCIVKSLRDGEVQADCAVRDDDVSTSAASARQRDKLTIGLRSALNAGIPIDELAQSTGLTVEQINRRIARPLSSQ